MNIKFPPLLFRLFAPLPPVAHYITCTVVEMHVNFTGRQSAPTKTTATVVFAEGGVSRSSLQHFNKSKNFASFRSKILYRKGPGGSARTLFMSFSSFGSTVQLSRQKKKPSLMFLHPPLLFFFVVAFFVPFLFFFWKKISRIKYGSHMLLLTSGIHCFFGLIATQTDGQGGVTEVVAVRKESKGEGK